MDRILKPTDYYFANAVDIAAERITSVEGASEAGEITVKVLLVGDKILMLEVFRKKGLVDPVHSHPDHESCGYLISGSMQLIIGESTFIASPGSSWIHPAGVDHYSEALEDSIQLEVKSPPRKTWKTT